MVARTSSATLRICDAYHAFLIHAVVAAVDLAAHDIATRGPGSPQDHWRGDDACRRRQAARELEKLIVSKKLAHGGNPVTHWMAANVAVAQDPAGNLKPARDKTTERIDGIVALIMGIGRAMVAQEEPQPEYSLFFV
jgi:Phage Terminase